MDVDAAADELYGLPPGEFVAARAALVKQARAAGERDVAAAVGELRRPAVAAWLVNLLAREAAPALTSLLDLGDALREAQSSLQGDQLRQLSAQRHQVVAALVRQARGMASAAGERVTDSVGQQLERTLEAALADPAVAEAVRSGQLTSPVEYAGFGLGGVGEAQVAQPSRSAGKAAPVGKASRADGAKTAPRAAGAKAKATAAAAAEQESAAERSAREERDRAAAQEQERARQAALEQARVAVASAEKQQAAREQQLAEADDAVAATAQELRGRREQVARLEQELDDARSAVTQAEESAARARSGHADAASAVDAARSGLQQARAALADLEG